MNAAPPQPQRSGARATQRARSQARILDAAEEVFAEHGYAGASVRDITDRAGVRLAAVSDHFGGKEALLQQVLGRRIDPLNTDRRTRLAHLPTRGSRSQRLRALILAFTEPMLHRAEESKGWRNYFRFIAQLANSRDPVQLLAADEYNRIATEMIEHLARLYPLAAPSVLHDAYQLLLAPSLGVFADNLRLDNLTAGHTSTSDLDARHRSLVTFLQGGIDQLCRTSTHPHDQRAVPRPVDERDAKPAASRVTAQPASDPR